MWCQGVTLIVRPEAGTFVHWPTHPAGSSLLGKKCIWYFLGGELHASGASPLLTGTVCHSRVSHAAALAPSRSPLAQCLTLCHFFSQRISSENKSCHYFLQAAQKISSCSLPTHRTPPWLLYEPAYMPAPTVWPHHSISYFVKIMYHHVAQQSH